MNTAPNLEELLEPIDNRGLLNRYLTSINRVQYSHRSICDITCACNMMKEDTMKEFSISEDRFNYEYKLMFGYEFEFLMSEDK